MLAGGEGRGEVGDCRGGCRLYLLWGPHLGRAVGLTPLMLLEGINRSPSISDTWGSRKAGWLLCGVLFSNSAATGPAFALQSKGHGQLQLRCLSLSLCDHAVAAALQVVCYG